jgi:hypothetical protein
MPEPPPDRQPAPAQQRNGRGEPGQGDATPPGKGRDNSGRQQWRVSPRLTVLRAVGVLVFAVAAVLGRGDPPQLFVAGLAAAFLAGYVLRDLLAPVRLAADDAGVTLVAGFAGRRRLSWSQIERLRVDARTRLGLRTELLEIDSGDNVYFFSSYELGEPCAAVVERLTALSVVAQREDGDVVPRRIR